MKSALPAPDCRRLAEPVNSAARPRDGPDGAALIAEITAYSIQVRRGDHRCATDQCPHCGCNAASAMFFRRHSFRQRQLFVIDDLGVRSVPCALARWRCPSCRRTFTDYPGFVVPYKRYVLPQIASRAVLYVERPGISYRKGVGRAGMLVAHVPFPRSDDAFGACPPMSDSDPILAHSSLYRWISTLGQRMLDRPDAAGGPVAQPFLPATWKFTTIHRRDLLIGCRTFCLASLAAG